MEVLGEWHPETIETHDSKASAFAAQGDHAKALEHLEKCLAARRETPGEHHLDAAGTYDSMAQAFHAQGRHDKALEHYEKSLAIRREVLGERPAPQRCGDLQQSESAEATDLIFG